MNNDREISGKVRRPSHSGFTLFEILLATALSVVLIGLLSMTVHLYLRSVDAGRTEVEEASIARSVLRRITDDLTSTVVYREIDAASTASFASAASSGRSTSGSSGSDSNSSSSSFSTSS